MGIREDTNESGVIEREELEQGASGQEQGFRVASAPLLLVCSTDDRRRNPVETSAQEAIVADTHAPQTWTVQFETTRGPFTVEVHRDWSPNGADRFYELVKSGFYDHRIAFFRVLSGFVAQFGIHGDPAVSAQWRTKTIKDDPVKESNAKGTLTFAMAGPNTRTTQLFINFQDNKPLDRMGFSPFGRVTEGMDVVESLYSGYGEGAPQGKGPDQGRIQREGNSYLEARFPELDYITSAKIVSEA